MGMLVRIEVNAVDHARRRGCNFFDAGQVLPRIGDDSPREGIRIDEDLLHTM